MLTLINETPHEAELVRLILGHERAAGVVVVKSTYDLARGRTCLSGRQRPVLLAPKTEDGASFEPEGILGKVGVDLLAVGAAAGDGRTTLSSVSLRVGGWFSQVLVLGDRFWRRSMLSWTMTEPRPFTQIPVAWSLAFGGVARIRGLAVPHAGNPEGNGYLLEVDGSVDGQPLPNLEDPAELLTRPGQSVPPVGFAPLPSSSALRLEAALDESKPGGVGKAIFNQAPPRHRVPELYGGERCEAHGWVGMGGEVFELPVESFVVEVDIEDRRYEFLPRIDTVCLWPARGQLVVTRRATFTYRYVRGAARAARLRTSARLGRHTGGELHVA